MLLEQNLSLLLDELEREMRRLSLWQSRAPSAQALQSTEPFAVDKLAPHEWLQWIFIARMRTLAQQNATIPRGFAIFPYFSEVWKQQSQVGTLLLLLQRIDEVCQ